MATSLKQNLKSAAYYGAARFANFGGFFSLVDEDGQLLPSSHSRTSRELIEADLRELHQGVRSANVQEALDQFNGPLAAEIIFNSIVDAATSFASVVERPKLFIVDRLPHPFGTRAWDAMCVDRMDEARLGIPRGIYFREAVRTHCYFEFVLAHEIGHWIVSQYTEGYFRHAPLLEEGVCDVLAIAIMLEVQLLPKAAIRNLLIYNRSTKHNSDLWGTYWREAQAVLNVVAEVGPLVLPHFLTCGRESLHQEAKSLQRDVTPSEPNHLSKSIMAVSFEANSILIIDIEDYAVLNTFLQRNVELMSINDLAAAVALGDTAVSSHLERLDGQGLVTVDDTTVFRTSRAIVDNARYRL